MTATRTSAITRFVNDGDEHFGSDTVVTQAEAPERNGEPSRAQIQVTPEDSVIGCRDLTKSFGTVTAVDHASFGVEEGEWFSIVGPNGAGKTTLVNMLNGFYDPDEGQVFLNGEDVTSLKSSQRARRGLARTFQGLELFEDEDVIENLMTIQGVANRPNLLQALLYYPLGQRIETENLRQVEEIIDFLELWEYRHANIATLPMGIRRRVDLARSLTLDPDVLILDESMSGLTFDEKYDIVRFLSDLRDEQNITLVMIEHDLEVVMNVSDRMMVLQEGQVIARDAPDVVTDDPKVQEVYTGGMENE